MTREEHMQWSKKRALEYLDNNNITNAFASLASDLSKHPETANHIGLGLTTQMIMIGKLRSVDEMRRQIEGFR